MNEKKFEEDLIKRIEEVQSYGNENSMTRREFITAAVVCVICLAAVIAGGFIV